MKSIAVMLDRIEGLTDTKDLSDWENKFVKNVWLRSVRGTQTTRLEERQVEIIEQIFNKHFGD